MLFLPHLSAALTSSPAGGGTYPSVTAASGGDISPCRGGQRCGGRGSIAPKDPAVPAVGADAIGSPCFPLRGKWPKADRGSPGSK